MTRCRITVLIIIAMIAFLIVPFAHGQGRSAPSSPAQGPTDKDLTKAVVSFLESPALGNVKADALVVRAIAGKHSEKDDAGFIGWFFDRSEIGRNPTQRFWLQTFVASGVTSLTPAVPWGKKLPEDTILGAADLTINGYTSCTFTRSWKLSSTSVPGSVPITVKIGSAPTTVYATELHE
jgi:hypothetical protein